MRSDRGNADGQRERLGRRIEPGVSVSPPAGVQPGVVLIRLDDLTIQAVNEAGRRRLDRPIHRLIGRPIVDVVDRSDRVPIAATLVSLRSGSIDCLRVHGLGATRSGTRAGFVAWANPVELDGVWYALARWLSRVEARWWRDPEAAGRRAVALAVVDRDGITRSAFVDPAGIAGIAAADLVGQTLVTPSGMAGEEDGRIGTTEEGGEGRPISVTTRDGRMVELRAVVIPLTGSPDSLVMLMVPPLPSPREADLESHLWRIAAEVEASGILLRAGPAPRLSLLHIPDAAALTPRQWEVLRRLVAGQRVPTIARELFITQSTVRNHLAAIFDRFGVRSQPELLARLTGLGAQSSTTDEASIA